MKTHEVTGEKLSAYSYKDLKDTLKLKDKVSILDGLKKHYFAYMDELVNQVKVLERKLKEATQNSALDKVKDYMSTEANSRSDGLSYPGMPDKQPMGSHLSRSQPHFRSAWRSHLSRSH